MTSGRSTAASRVIQKYNAELVTAISAGDLLSLTLKLYGEGLIERETKDDICLLVYTPLQKACIIVSAVERMVETDPSLINQFTALLQNEGDRLKAMSQRLMDEYKSMAEKECDTWTLLPQQPSSLESLRQPHCRKRCLSALQSPTCYPPPAKCHQSLFYQQFPVLCLYADTLRTIYAQSDLPQYSNPACYKWTPSPSRKYIDLSTIDRKGMITRQVHEYKKAVLYDQIIKQNSTSTVKLKEILQVKPGEKLECVLVEGPPGIGKSTLAWQVCNRWGKGELFQQYFTVLLLPLRDQRVQGATCVKDLFISTDKNLQEMVRKEVSQKHWDGRNTLIILEGLDELPSHLLSQPSIFTAFLSGEALSQATIFITSRPSATEYLHKYWKQRVSRHFEIRGFTEENVAKYAQSVLSDSEQLSGFIEYVSIHPHIQSMLYIPLHSVIAITVYLQCQQSHTPPPKTLTGLYTCLTQTILTQYLNDHPQYTSEGHTLDKVFDLHIPCPVHNYFKELCRIAFEHLSDRQLIFSNMPKELHDLGFTDAVPELLLYHHSVNYSYNFLHLSVQEFLAAYHVSLKSPNEQEYLLRMKCYGSCESDFILLPESHFRNMFQFVAGITKFKLLNKVIVRQAISIHENFSLINGSRLEQSMNDFSLEVLYECQDVSILETEYTYIVKLYHPSPHNCLALGYCIANSNCRWKLQLSYCFNGAQAEMIFQGLKESKVCHCTIESIQCDDCSTNFTHKLFSQYAPETFVENIVSLNFEQSSYLPQSLLPSLIPRMKRLKALTLRSLCDTSLTELLTALSKVPSMGRLTLHEQRALTTIIFCNNSIDAIEVTGCQDCTAEFINVNYILSQLLLQSITLRKLILRGLNLEGLTILCQWLPICQLETLRLPFLSSDDIEMVSRALTIVSSPKTLDILGVEESKFTIKSMQAFASMLQQNQSLTELNIDGCSIDSDSICYLAEALHHCNTTLRKLDMNWNPIGERGALAMAKMLKYNTTLEELNLRDAEVYSDGVVAMAEALQHNTILRKLDMSVNPVGEKGALALAEMLKHNTTLEELELMDADISNDGAVAMAEALQHNTILRKLDMSVNPVGEKGALAIAEMLKQNKTLEVLDLNTNDTLISNAVIGIKGIKSLVETLKVNQHLKKLIISCKHQIFVETLAVYHDHKERVNLEWL